MCIIYPQFTLNLCYVHVALDKLLKSMLIQVGSQRNKLRDTAISLQSLKTSPEISNGMLLI